MKIAFHNTGGLREKYYGSHGKALKVKLRKY